MGETRIPAGRFGEAPALRLSERLIGLGLALGRLKTGTPARLVGRSIDWAVLEDQKGDDPPVPFSFLTDKYYDAADLLPYHDDDSRRPMISFARICHRAPMYSGTNLAALVRDTVRRSRTRSCGSRIASGIRSSWSRKGSTTTRSIRTGSRRRCRRTCRSISADHAGARAGRDQAAGVCDRVRSCRSAGAVADAGSEAAAGVVPGRADQRHDGIRGGGRAGAGGRAQCGAGGGRRRAAS